LTTPAVRAADKDIFEAARTNNAAEAKQLILDHTDISKPGPDGFTPLILAAYNGNVEMVGLLLENHADVHTGSRMGNALMAASFRGYTEIVEKLLKAGARVNDANEAGGTALMYAALSGSTDVIRLLIRSGAQVNPRDRRGLDAATLAQQQGNQEVADVIPGSDKGR
jgi:ankyrin repeat protein